MFLFFLSISMLMPTLPLYLIDLGAGPVEVGLVIGIFSFGVLVARPFVGKAVDTRGRRPIMVLGSLLALAVAPGYMVFSAFSALIAVRLVHGAGLSAFTSATTTLMADLSPPDRRTEFLGYLSTSSIVAFAFGPVVGIEIVNRIGYGFLFASIGVIAFLSAVLGSLISEPQHDGDGQEPIDYRQAILRRKVLVPTVTLLLVTLTLGGSFTFLPILLEETLDFNIGAFFLTYAVASFFIRLNAGPISRRLGDGPMVWSGLIIYGLGSAMLPWVVGWKSLVVVACVMALGFGIYQPAVYSFVTNAASERTRGMVLSFFLGAFDLGMSLGGLAAGPLVAVAGIPTMLRLAGFVPVIAGVVFVVYLGWKPSADTCETPGEVIIR